MVKVTAASSGVSPAGRPADTNPPDALLPTVPGCVPLKLWWCFVQDLLLGTMQAERRQFSQLLAQRQAPHQAPQQASPVRAAVTAAACGSTDLVRAAQAKQAHVDAWRLARTPAVWWAESGTTPPDGSQKKVCLPLRDGRAFRSAMQACLQWRWVRQEAEAYHKQSSFSNRVH